MHSYDNGTNMSIKQDNWKQLKKFFKKKEIPHDDKLIDDVIHCKTGAIVVFVNQMYTTLTQRKVVPPPERDDDTNLPPIKVTSTSSASNNKSRDTNSAVEKSSNSKHDCIVKLFYFSL